MTKITYTHTPDYFCIDFRGHAGFAPAETIDLFAELTPLQKKWGKFKGVTMEKVINAKYKIKERIHRHGK